MLKPGALLDQEVDERGARVRQGKTQIACACWWLPLAAFCHCYQSLGRRQWVDSMVPDGCIETAALRTGAFTETTEFTHKLVNWLLQRVCAVAAG